MPKRTDISSLPLIGAGPVAKCSGVSLPTDLSVSPRLRRNRSCRALQPPYRGAGLSRRSSHPRSRLADQTLSHAPTPAHNDAMPVHRNPAGDRHKVSLAPGNCFPVVFAAFRSATRQHPLAILPARPMTTINPQRGACPRHHSGIGRSFGQLAPHIGIDNNHSSKMAWLAGVSGASGKSKPGRLPSKSICPIDFRFG